MLMQTCVAEAKSESKIDVVTKQKQFHCIYSVSHSFLAGQELAEFKVWSANQEGDIVL